MPADKADSPLQVKGAVCTCPEIKKRKHTMIQRMLSFAFTADATEEQKAQHFAEFAALQAVIPQIARYSGGPVFSMNDGNVNPPEYDSLHLVSYTSQKDVEIYHDHPAHKKFIERNKAIWAKVLVLDAELRED
jgi:hypothetical protein